MVAIIFLIINVVFLFRLYPLFDGNFDEAWMKPVTFTILVVITGINALRAVITEDTGHLVFKAVVCMICILFEKVMYVYIFIVTWLTIIVFGILDLVISWWIHTGIRLIMDFSFIGACILFL